MDTTLYVMSGGATPTLQHTYWSGDRKAIAGIEWKE